MTVAYADRVKQTSTTTGTGTLSLTGAVDGYQTFVGGVGDAGECTFCIEAVDGDGVPTGDWEVSQGVVTDAATDTLTRATVLASSNSGSLVSFSAGTKNVFLVHAATNVLGPRAYGSITVEGNSILTSISTKSSNFSNKVQVTIFDTNGSSQNCTPDHTTDDITIVADGDYTIEAQISFSVNSANTVSFALFKNNGATQLGIRGTKTGAAVSSVEHVTLKAEPIALVETDTIELWVQNEDTDSDILVEDAVLSVRRID